MPQLGHYLPVYGTVSERGLAKADGCPLRVAVVRKLQCQGWR